MHADYLAAGADIILTCTFGGSRLKLPAGIEPVPFNREMARIARSAAEAAGRPVFVAGDMGPCGRFVRPLGDLHPLELYEALREQARGLAEGGVDLFLVETQFDLAEVRIAVAAIRAESDLPVMVSMTFEQGTSLTGTTPEIFAETMQNLGVDALGLNCGLGPEEMAPLMERFLACSSVPVLAEPNAGLPELVDGKTVFRLPPEPFAENRRLRGHGRAAGGRLLRHHAGSHPGPAPRRGRRGAARRPLRHAFRPCADDPHQAGRDQSLPAFYHYRRTDHPRAKRICRWNCRPGSTALPCASPPNRWPSVRRSLT
ncbi:MAG: homocysteine S-methyltransferase family protein [Bilophila sp.]